MKVEDHRFGLSEEGLELPVSHAMWVFGVWDQLEKVYNVYESNLYVRQILAEQGGGGQGLHGRHVAAARHDHIRLVALVIAGPIPYTRTFRAVRGSRIHI